MSSRESDRSVPNVAKENSVPVEVIVGPTASGKTALSYRLHELNPDIEIISADSRQVYVGMDIGTAKASAEFRRTIPHHLIDIISPDQLYSAGRFARDAERAIASIVERGKTPLVVGGTGFYIRALFEGLTAPPADPEIYAQLEARVEEEGYASLLEELIRVDPEAAASHPPENRVKTLRALACYYQTGLPYSQFRTANAIPHPRYIPHILCLMPERTLLYERINQRVLEIVEQGLLDETRRLVEGGYGPESPGMKTVGYAEALKFLHGEIEEGEMIAMIGQSTRRYAKRQITWFRNQFPDANFITE